MNAILKISISFTLFYGYYCFGSEIGENLDKAIKRKYYCGWSGLFSGKPIKILNDEEIARFKGCQEDYKRKELLVKGTKKKYYSGWLTSYFQNLLWCFKQPVKILNDEEVARLKGFQEDYKRKKS